MRKLGIALLLSLFCVIGSTFAQDTITLRTGEEIQAIVTEVGKYEIWYKRYENQEGPIYSMPTSDIFMIKYPNGQKDIFNTSTISAYPPSSQYFNRKDPAVACIFSLLIPGGGQYYNGQTGKGVLMTGIWLGTLIGMVASVPEDSYYDYYGYYHYSGGSPGTFTLCALAFVGNYVWSMIDAPISANNINKRNGILSWNLGKDTNLSIKPDISMTNHQPMYNTSFSPTYGAKISLSLR